MRGGRADRCRVPRWLSRVRGGADEHSDYDISVIVVDASYRELIAKKDGFVRLLGQPLFLEDFGNENVAFVIFADGVELELLFFHEGDLRSIRSGPHRVLYDEPGILSGLEFPPPKVDPEEQARELRKLLFWFWHDLGHFAAAIKRGQLWWAAGQLEQLRHYCVRLIRIEQDVDPNAHVAFFQAPSHQRLYLDPVMNLRQYVDLWEGPGWERIGGYSQGKLTASLWPWLKEQGCATAADDSVFGEFLRLLGGRRAAHLRPGLRAERMWPRGEVAARPALQLAADVRAEVNRVLRVIGEPSLPAG